MTSQLEKFLRLILPEEGVYVSSTQHLTNWKDQFADSLDGLLELIDQGIQNYCDTYVALETFGSPELGRKAENVFRLKVHRLDLDCGPGKPYTTKKQAIKALGEFIQKIPIGMPHVVVDSGNGLHLYWVHDRALSPTEWLATAEMLKQTCHDHNLQADHACTADLARVFRAPTSFNYKDRAHPLPCTIRRLSDTPGNYEDFKLALSMWTAPATVPWQDDSMENMMAGLEPKDFGPRYAKHMVASCGVMAAAVAEGGKSDQEPEWMQKLYLLSFCDDGEDYIHTIGNQHPDYSPATTEYKYKGQKAKPTRKGPPLCKTFRMYQPDICAMCIHSGQIKTPLQLGKAPTTGLPYPYEQDEKGIYIVEVRKDDNGTDVKDRKRLLPIKMEGFSVHRCGDEKMTYCFTATIGEHVEECMIPAGIDDAARRMAMMDSGFPLHPYQAKILDSIMTAWAQQLAKSKQLKKAAKSFGWTEEGKRLGFTTGTGTYWPDKSVTGTTIAKSALNDCYTPTGDPEVWKQAVGLVMKNGDIALQCALATAFAAPLIRVTPLNGVVVSFQSWQSGNGKTQALKTAQSVWGSPVAGMQLIDDTPLSLSKKLTVLNSLPAYWDEVRAHGLDEFAQLLFRFSQGKDKSRLNSNAEVRDTGTWETMLTCATNKPIQDSIRQTIKDTAAGQLRVIEFAVGPLKDTQLSSEAMKTFGKLDKNYGHAGITYATWLVANLDHAEAVFHQAVERLTQLTKPTNQERFQINTYAALLTGAMLAREIGLINFDITAMGKFMMAHLHDMRTELSVDAGTPDDLVREYYRQHRKNFVHYKVLSRRGVPGELLVSRIEERQDQILGHVAAGHHFRLALIPFREWLFRNGHSDTSLREQFGRRMVKRRLVLDDDSLQMGKGGRIFIYEVKLKK